MDESQRGNTTHGPQLDDQMKQETRGMVQGHGAAHAEPFRESEPLPDDTDAEETRDAFRGDGARAGDAPASADPATEDTDADDTDDGEGR